MPEENVYYINYDGQIVQINDAAIIQKLEELYNYNSEDDVYEGVLQDIKTNQENLSSQVANISSDQSDLLNDILTYINDLIEKDLYKEDLHILHDDLSSLSMTSDNTELITQLQLVSDSAAAADNNLFMIFSVLMIWFTLWSCTKLKNMFYNLGV